MWVMVPRARGGSRILCLEMSEFSKAEPKMSPPVMWSPTRRSGVGVNSHAFSLSRASVAIPRGM